MNLFTYLTATATSVDLGGENIDTGIDLSFLSWSAIGPKAVQYGIKIVFALIVFFIGSKVIHAVVNHFRKLWTKRNTEIGVVQFASSLLKVILYIVLVLVIFKAVGIEIASISALVASSGLTIGLALQGSLSNFAGGVIILLIKPFQVGDYIIEDSAKNEGHVEKISMFYTTLRTNSGRYVMVPNGTLANSSLTNISAMGKTRVETVVGITYATDIDKAREVALQAMEKDPFHLPNEPVRVTVKQLNDSSVDLACRFWVKPEDYWKETELLPEMIKKAFDEAGIEIPFPQVTISYLKGEE